MKDYKEPEMVAVELEDEDVGKANGGSFTIKPEIDEGKVCGNGFICISDM